MNNYYWSADVDKHIIDYNLATTSTRRNIIYNAHLALPFLTMAQAIFNRYFLSFLNLLKQSYIEVSDLINDAISHLVLRLNQYKTSTGKSYSFCQTVIKNYYISFFKKLSEEKNRITSIDGIDVEDQDSNIETIKNYKLNLLKKLNAIQTTNVDEELVLTYLIYFLFVVEHYQYNIYFLSIFLKRKTGLTTKVINKVLKNKGIKIVLFTEEKVEEIFNLNHSIEISNELGELIAVQLIAKQNDKKFKITNKANIKRKNWKKRTNVTT